MTIGIDGMVSGLDTTKIVDGLIAIQANQRVLLKQKSSAASSLVSALQALNSRVSSLATAAKKVADPASWGVTKATSSSDTVTVSADATAKPGTVELRVDQLAKGQVSLLDPAALGGGFSLTTGGTTHAVTPSSAHVDDIAAAVNGLTGETGVTATKVRTGTDASGGPTYSLQLTGATGAANSFSVEAGGATVASSADAMVAAQDAKVTLWPSAGTGLALTSSTNTFTDVLEGVDLTVSSVDTTPTTISVAADASAQHALADELIANVSTVLSEIASRTRTTTSTDSGGNTVVSGGVLSGDSAVRFLTNNVQSAMTSPVNGQSPATIGISIDRTGAISLDKTAFADALADDPEATMATLQAVAARVGEVATKASAPTEGTLTRKITSQESVIKDLGTQITRWDERLETRRAQLVAQFSAMEVRLSQLNSTQSWLTNQIAGLNASKG
ncbi:flagellar filament capping protein FliD [Georgenia sp. H159]|uniref:flagellar filament capping protein FliD n=1 Tax=Georgenia sp. H159 TaxID=3076115 RepID=UPI002D795827|nr:flagellar filament capping protein FliD [Georgenia sp. H159]